MKNKKTAYYLIPVVILVWGSVIFKAVNPDEENSVIATNEGEKTVPRIEKAVNDSFELVADYRDPFLGSMPRSNKKSTQTTIAKRKKRPARVKIKKEKKVNWPNVAYSGSIKNQSSEYHVAIVKVNEEERLLALHDEHMGVMVSKIFKDSIMVSYQNENRIIAKTKEAK